MFGMARAAWLPGWVPAKALRLLPVSERLEERRVGTGRFFPGGLPALSTRMMEAIVAAVIVLVIRSVPYSTTRELGMILLSLSGAVLVVLGVAEFRNWRRWS